MRLLIINPNTTHALTHKIESLAQSFLGYSTKITTVSGRFGPRYIASRATFAIACHATIDAYAEHGTDSDCVLLACFGDPGLEALREVCPGPVIGLIDASANGLIGMADKISMIRSYPVICSVMAGLRAVKAISETNPRKIHLPNLQRVETIGLSKSLAELLLQEEFSIKGDSYDL